MKKMIDCRYWKEYQGMNGWLMFCSAGAFAKEFHIDDAEEIGCTTEQRAICKKTMNINMGYSLLPKIVDASQKKEELKDTVTAPGKPA